MGEHSGHHIVPFKVLVNVMVILLVATVATVLFAKFVHLGFLGTPVAFLIAATKAYFVMAYFMGLKYDSPHNRLIFSTGFIFLALLFFFCALDIWTRIKQDPTL